MKSVRKILLVFFTGLLIFSVWKLVNIYAAYWEGQASYASLEQYVSFADPIWQKKDTGTKDLHPTEYGASEPSAAGETDDTQWPWVDFEELARINPDIVGWIFIEGTNINYPVVQGDNNDYYLSHLFDGTYNGSGCIFLDADCSPDFTDQHSIIYGHHMKDKSMFYGLVEYKSQEYYEEHSVALLLTPTHRYKIQLFSGYVSDTWSNAWDKDFSEYTFKSWLKDIKARSGFSSEHTPDESDLILTLSTCTYEFDTAKYVLHGYIAEAMENPS